MKIHLISLGCAKNLVDSEYLLGLLAKNGHVFVGEPQDADVVILTTCSFIGEARREAKQYISKLVKLKRTKNFKLVVTGCLPQLEKENIFKNYKEVDAIFGVSDYHRIPQILQKLSLKKKMSVISTQESFLPTCKLPRILSTPKSYAYLKIADGCDNRCAYCLIPTIRGSYRERLIEDIVKEAQQIVAAGVKELILISHDTTLYGIKLYKKQMLHKLVAKLSKIKGVYFIRILYSHPAHFYDELIEEIASNEKVCKYVDIPIQHTSDKILSLMGRRITRAGIYKLVEKLRKKINNITLRTTVMVGFPTETEKDFKILLSDISDLEFDWLGCFKFSSQDGTKAKDIFPKVDIKIKQQRYAEVMKLQQKIVYKKNKQRIGKTYPLIVDGVSFGHTEFQCPEVDGKTYFLSPPADVITKVKIKNVQEIYDLKGEILD